MTFAVYLLISGGWAYFFGAIVIALISLIDHTKTISPFLRILWQFPKILFVVLTSPLKRVPI